METRIKFKLKGLLVMIKVIAEIGWNFMGDMGLAKEMINAAKKAGANTVKFQYWNPARLKAGPWDTDGRKEVYESAQLNEEKIKELIVFCDKAEIEFLISAFNVVDAAFIAKLGIKSIKIPSHEVANFELHEFSAKNFDEIYVSLGAGTEEEVLKAIETYKTNAGDKFWVGMHCVSSYPCPAEKANLSRINFIKENCPMAGYSDHTSDVISPVVSVALGAQVVEKHFTVNKELPGRDNKFALDIPEFEQMVKNIRLAEAALISHGNGPIDIESDTMTNYRGRWGANK